MVAYLVALLGCVGSLTPPPAGDPSRPDVILVSVDTLRADHLSSYGHTRLTTPFLDRLAAQGVRFTQARSPAPWTLPAHTSLLTGRSPLHHQVIEDDLRLDPATPVLPELFQRAGYATAGFVATLYVSRIFGFERGFDHFEDFDLHDERRNLAGEVVASDVLDAARRWLAGLPPGKPYFLFLHVYDAHYTYDPPAPFATLFDRAPEKGDEKYRNYAYYKKHPVEADQLAHQVAQYDEAIRYVDSQLEGLAGTLEGRPTRWVVTADHGEEFGERGSWGHAHTLYAEQLHVPLILSGPGLPARVVTQPVGLEDVAPTLARWAGQPLAADGLDLAPAIAGETLPERRFVADTSRFDTNRVSILDRGLRLEWDLKGDRPELYDVVADPTERHDLATSRPDAVAALTLLLEQALGAPWQATVEGQIQTDGAVLSRGAHPALSVQPGARFAVLPADASVRLRTSIGSSPTYSAAGGARPGPEAPLRLDRTAGASDVQLSDEQRSALEALGYIQSDEGG